MNNGDRQLNSVAIINPRKEISQAKVSTSDLDVFSGPFHYRLSYIGLVIFSKPVFASAINSFQNDKF